MIVAVLCCFIAAWWGYGVLSHAGGAPHDDVTEAYVWGREFQLGYPQHPPFWAWVAGAWFLVFPRADWAFVLLAVVNSAVGLAGAWRLVGRFVPGGAQGTAEGAAEGAEGGAARQAAWLLLLCTPFYTFACYKYNANTIFLSIWPWTLFFFVRAMDTGRVRDGLWFGLMVGLAMLSKYYGVILVATCLVASLLHPRARAYWRSASPWAAMATAAVVGLPHAAWLVANGAPPIRYALSVSMQAVPNPAGRNIMELLAILAMQLAIPVLVWVTRRRGCGMTPGVGPGVTLGAELPMVAVMVLMPVLLTFGFGLVFSLRRAAEMLIGTFPLAPVLVIALVPGADPARLARWTSRIVAVGTVVSLASGPFVARLLERPRDPSWNLPLREAAEAAEAIWHEKTGRPLAIVGGTKHYSNAAPFYTKDSPSGFLLLEPAFAPWLTPERIRAGGVLAMCYKEAGPMDDEWCRGNVARLSTPRTTHSEITVTHRAFGRARGTATLDVYVIPPEP